MLPAPRRSGMFFLLLAGALGCGAFAAAPASANCGAEGCPLVREGLGAQGGRYAFDVRYQDVTQDHLWKGGAELTRDQAIAGGDLHGDIELLTHSRSWVAEGRANPTERLQLTATLPYVDREHQHWSKHSATFNSRYLHTWQFQGLADATLLAHYRALERAGTSVTLHGGIKLPTGRTHVPGETQSNPGLPEAFDTTLEPSARPGSGSTDWIAGGMLTQRLPWKRTLPVSASGLLRFNRKGTDGFQMGDELQLGVSSGYTPHERVTLLGQINYSSHGDDRSAEASEIAHSGMQALFVTPGITMQVAPRLAVYGLYQARAWGHTKEATVVATNHFIFGTTYSIH